MSHVIIITTPPSAGGGGSFTAQGSSATVKTEWAPGHNLTPAQVSRRTERADRMAEKIVEMLNAPAGEEAHVE
jgi:hypothetical protein